MGVTSKLGPAEAVQTAMLRSSLSEIDVFIYGGECRSTKLFRISIPEGAMNKQTLRTNNSTTMERYGDAITTQNYSQYSRTEQSNSDLIYILRMKSQGALRSCGTAFITAPCQIKLRWVQHKNNIYHSTLSRCWGSSV